MPTQPLAAPRSTAPPARLFKGTLWLFVSSMAFSVAGMLLLMWVPSTLRLFGPYLATLVVAPTWTYMALLPVLPILMYTPMLGGKRMVLFVIWGSVVGGTSELIGTSIGVPFGEYLYTAWLGPKILGHVPYFIPLSWFAMSIISLDLAQRVVNHRLGRLLLGATFMVLWDVSLDPAMNGAGTAPIGGVDMFWTYPSGAFYYGMPLSNWAGWFGVALLIMTGYEFLGGGLPARSRWASWVYFLNCLFPLTLCLLYGLYGATLAGAAATVLPLWLAHRYGQRHAAPASR